MGKLEDDLDNILGQFISIDELLSILADFEKTTKQNVAVWLLTSGILGRTKELVFIDNYLLVEYKKFDRDYYTSPFDTLTLIAQGEEAFFTECIGFARKRILIDIKNKGLNISDELIKDSTVYISNKSHESDDNFYKNQCLDLNKELAVVKKSIKQEPLKLSSVHKYALYLNKNNPLYFSDLELLARIHHELNVMNMYSGRSNKDDRIKDFLKDYGAEYGYKDPKPFHIKKISSFINIVKDQKPTIEILNELVIGKEEKSN